MASEIYVNIKCEPYLIRYLEKLYGPQPISFPKNSYYNLILDEFLAVPPPGYIEPDYGDHNLKIELPFLEHKNIKRYFYLSDFHQVKFVKRVWRHFHITYRGDISKHLCNGFDKTESLEIFMEKYNLPDNVWDALLKDFLRFQKLRSVRKLLRNNKSSSD